MTEQYLMKLVADYGKECISAGIADLVADDNVKQRMADDVRKSHLALTDRLRALLAELEAAREDAARYQWLAVQHWVEQEATFRLGLKNVDFINTYLEELGVAIDAARKGEA